MISFVFLGEAHGHTMLGLVGDSSVVMFLWSRGLRAFRVGSAPKGVSSRAPSSHLVAFGCAEHTKGILDEVRLVWVKARVGIWGHLLYQGKPLQSWERLVVSKIPRAADFSLGPAQTNSSINNPPKSRHGT